MKKDSEFLAELVTVIRKELESIDLLRAELESELKKNSNPRVLGSILHDFYNCCERIFKRIASEINGGFYDSYKWHKELLYRMTVAVEGLRPAVISEELAAELDEYLSFRHVFRNIYGFELKGERLTRLSAGFGKVAGCFKQELEAFIQAVIS